MKIIFMGTPDFAENVLKTLSKEHEIVLCVTQPDKESGRGKDIHFSPVKEWAASHDVPVFQPVKIREQDSIDYLSKIEADAIVVCAFGQILPEAILNMKKYGAINVHASLLPLYRGASPIQWSILNGDEFTGITIMQMGVGLDDGDLLLQKKIKIEPDETGGGLFEKLSHLGGELINETLKKLPNGEITPRAQDNEKAVKVGLIGKEMGHIDFKKPALDIERMMRAFDPWPSAYARFDGKTMKFMKAKVLDALPEDIEIEDGGKSLSCGEAVRDGDAFYIKTGLGFLKPEIIQKEGKKRMAVADFLRGHDIKTGDLFV